MVDFELSELYTITAQKTIFNKFFVCMAIISTKDNYKYEDMMLCASSYLYKIKNCKNITYHKCNIEHNLNCIFNVLDALPTSMSAEKTIYNLKNELVKFLELRK